MGNTCGSCVSKADVGEARSKKKKGPPSNETEPRTIIVRSSSQIERRSVPRKSVEPGESAPPKVEDEGHPVSESDCPSSIEQEVSNQRISKTIEHPEFVDHVATALAAHYPDNQSIAGLLKTELPPLLADDGFKADLVDYITRNIGIDTDIENILKALRESKELSANVLAGLLDSAVLRSQGRAPLSFNGDGKQSDKTQD